MLDQRNNLYTAHFLLKFKEDSMATSGVELVNLLLYLVHKCEAAVLKPSESRPFSCPDFKQGSTLWL